MSTFIVVENTKTGQRKTISQLSWDLMRNSRDQGDMRKGYRLVKDATAATEKAKAANTGIKTPTFIPPAIEEAARAAALADQAAQAQMISGAKLVEAPGEAVAAPVAQATQAPAPAAEAVEQEAPDEAPADLPTELAGMDEALTPKVAQVLAKAGISTRAHLHAATLPTINKALEAAGLGAKRAQAAGWKSKANPKTK